MDSVIQSYLQSIASFHHEDTIQRFLGDYEMPYEEALDVFNELKKFLSLCAATPDDVIFIVGPLRVIDEMWHTFLLFTRDYQEFCMTHFGRMVHHFPPKYAEVMQAKTRIEQDPEEAKNAFKPEVKKLYGLIYDYLGAETLIKWNNQYGEKYTIAYLNSIRKPLD